MRSDLFVRHRSAVIKTLELHYDLPPDLIAQSPADPRDASRLMIVDRARGEILHRTFREIAQWLHPGDCLVRNATRVLPAKFEARRESGAVVGGLFLNEIAAGRWSVLLSNTKRVRDGEWLSFGASKWRMAIRSRGERGQCEVVIDPSDAAVVVLGEIGTTPLPPYIRRDAGLHSASPSNDAGRYQTVYAQTPGSVAAPTAGLHFTPQLLESISAKNVSIADVTLHVGLGTFQPVTVDDLADHRMHREWYELTQASAERIRAARDGGRAVVAVGTTSVRVLESVARDGELRAASGWTDIFIYPPYEFREVDRLLTNFHLPGSTLLALVCAFAGYDLMMEAYAEAVKQRYRFFSYGDAMMIV